MEKIALEVRHLSQTEMREVEEGRPEGSSAIPHKRNPILSERLCGLARVVRESCKAGPSDMNGIRPILPCRGRNFCAGCGSIRKALGLRFSEGLLLALVRAGKRSASFGGRGLQESAAEKPLWEVAFHDFRVLRHLTAEGT